MCNENQNNGKKLIRSKNIICPECGEDIKIKINNYKIDLFECKNNHVIKSLSLNEFEKIQMIDLTKIKCDICKENNYCNSYNNKFYKCYECNENICPLCKLKHNENHNILEYDKIHYICNKHNEPYTNYCKNCKKNICLLCDEEHTNHEKISFTTMLIKEDKLKANLNQFKSKINIFNKNINKIIEVLNKVKEKENNYYKMIEFIINNYSKKERNYEILYNINEIINNNNDIINDLNKINSDNNILNQFNFI